MGAAYFYHLTRSGPDSVLQSLLGKSVQAGWRIAVRGTDLEVLRRIDELLWLRPEDGFLAHGLAGGDYDADQPILLTTAPDLPNGAECVMSIGGAEVSADEVKALTRVCILFDGQDGAALQTARGQWKALTTAGCQAQYWSEDSGSWEKKAESG